MNQFRELIERNNIHPDDAAAILGVSRRTVFYWLEEDPKPWKLIGVLAILNQYINSKK